MTAVRAPGSRSRSGGRGSSAPVASLLRTCPWLVARSPPSARSCRDRASSSAEAPKPMVPRASRGEERHGPRVTASARRRTLRDVRSEPHRLAARRRPGAPLAGRTRPAPRSGADLDGHPGTRVLDWWEAFGRQPLHADVDHAGDPSGATMGADP